MPIRPANKSPVSTNPLPAVGVPKLVGYPISARSSLAWPSHTRCCCALLAVPMPVLFTAHCCQSCLRIYPRAMSQHLPPRWIPAVPLYLLLRFSVFRTPSDHVQRVCVTNHKNDTQSSDSFLFFFFAGPCARAKAREPSSGPP